MVQCTQSHLHKPERVSLGFQWKRMKMPQTNRRVALGSKSAPTMAGCGSGSLIRLGRVETGAVGLRRASHKHVTKPISRVLYHAPAWGRGDGHSSRASCRQAPLATNPGGSSGNETGGFEAAAPPLFGLAPGGVCRAAPVARTAVRSYRTLSPLPRKSEAVCFLWHCPWGRPRRRLSGTVLPRSPDFPLCLADTLATNRAAIRPADGGNKGLWEGGVKLAPQSYRPSP
jgi:hypothetical protein